jgi:DNA-binding CsgD family transcriptional regulator
VQSTILERLSPHYDAIVESIYRAGSGLESWLRPLNEIAHVFDAWAVQLLGVNKSTGVMSFSFEAGSAPPAGPVEYLRHYHRIDPRLAKVGPFPPGKWFACEEHFDPEFVEKSPFYQEYLIPLGARYLYGVKLHEDDSHVVLIGHISKTREAPMSPEEKAQFARLSEHFGKAFDIQRELAPRSDRQSVGAELLERIRQPMILVDHQRRISYRNRNAADLLDRSDIVYDLGGALACRDSDSDLDLTLALRKLVLIPLSTHGDTDMPLDRHSFRLRRKDGRSVAATLIALRPEATMSSFGRTPQALFTVFEPGAAVDVDPFILSTTFGLTPAEARIAARIVNGSSAEECARELGVKISTVRSHLISIFAKTGATGQADLVRMILSASSI